MHHAHRAFGVLAGLAIVAAPAVAGGTLTLIGYIDLVDRLGGPENVPTGADVVVGQVEAPSGGAYGPNQGSDEFTGKTFTAHSGAPGSSGHATTVATAMYGNNNSAAPGVSDIHLWEASNWVFGGFLNYSSPLTVGPDAPPPGLRIFNNSWVGSLGSNANDNIVLRRADVAAASSDLLMIVGVNNSGTSPALLFAQYNGIAVGRDNGAHASNDTPGGLDGPGRMKPELVAPGSATSFSTPVVSACAALLIDTARTDPGLARNPFAERSETIKAVLMAGAEHRAGWTNNPQTSGPQRGVTARPLDNVYGADLVNIDRSHLILTAGEQDASSTPPPAPTIAERGWDYASVAIGASAYYRFRIVEPADDVSILATWHRNVRLSSNQSVPGNFDLTLWRVGPGEVLESLVGDAGLDDFGGGNVVSQSAVDNVEHLHLTDLMPGDYVIEVDRLDATGIYPQWDVAVAWIMPDQPDAVPGDLDGDGTVGPADLAQLLGAWGACDGCPEDLDGDGTVGPADLAILLGHWGAGG